MTFNNKHSQEIVQHHISNPTSLKWASRRKKKRQLEHLFKSLFMLKQQHSSIPTHWHVSPMQSPHKEPVMRNASCHGRQLIDLCKTTGMMIFNGRLGNDCGTGKFTRIQGASAGVVDYAFGSTTLFDKIIEFDVNDKFPESDHVPVSFSLSSNNMSEPEACEHKFRWTRLTRYKWSDRDLPVVKATLNDKCSREFRSMFLFSMSERSSTNVVAQKFNDYMIQAIHRVCPVTSVSNRGRSRAPYWYDHECRTKRSHAIAAGARVQSASDRGKHLVACREYRACVQRKKRNFRHKNVQHVTQIYVRDKAKLWKALDRMSNTFMTNNGPDRDMFANHFESLSKSPSACYFNKEYERQALDFLKRYD